MELNCETDFVAKTPEFRELVKDIAMHIAALAPRYVRREDVSQGEIDQEKEIYRSKALDSGKPEKIVERVVEGQLGKFFGEVCLLEQPFVKDPSITVGQLVADRIASTKENINVRRFVRFKLGEGLQRRSADFAGEVAAQLD